MSDKPQEEKKPIEPEAWLNPRPEFESMSDADLVAWIHSVAPTLIKSRHLTDQGLEMVLAIDDRVVAAKSLFYMAEGAKVVLP